IRSFTWIGRHELALLLALLSLAGGTLVFAHLAAALLDGALAPFDERLLLALRNPADLDDPLGPRWLEETARDFTALGSTGVLLLLGCSVLTFLLLSGRVRTAVFTVFALSSGFLLSTLLKQGFDRPRPDLVPHAAEVFTS